MNIEKLIAPVIIGYCVIAVLTFGIAYNKDYEYKECTQTIWCNSERAENGVRAFFDAIAWPAYLSVSSFEFMRKPKP